MPLLLRRLGRRRWRRRWQRYGFRHWLGFGLWGWLGLWLWCGHRHSARRCLDKGVRPQLCLYGCGLHGFRGRDFPHQGADQHGVCQQGQHPAAQTPVVARRCKRIVFEARGHGWVRQSHQALTGARTSRPARRVHQPPAAVPWPAPRFRRAGSCLPGSGWRCARHRCLSRSWPQPAVRPG